MGNSHNGAEAKGSGSAAGCLSALSFLLLVLFVVGFLVMFFGLRTERGENAVRDSLEKKFDMELGIEGARLGGFFEIVVENIHSKETDEHGEPVLKIKELKVGLNMDGTMRISVHRASLMLMPGRKGGWIPGIFSRLGELPGQHMGDLSELTDSFRKRASLTISDSSVLWKDRAGNADVTVSGMSFEMRPMKLPGRDVFFYRLEAYNVLGSGNVNIHNIKREWLASDAVCYLSVDKLSPQSVINADDFWEIR